MSGWLDWIEDIFICPFCGEEFPALFCEGGELNREPIVVTTLAANKTVCPSCKKDIVDDDLSNEND